MRNKLTVGFEFLGDQSVKNISEPVPMFRVRINGSAKESGRRPGGAPQPLGLDQAASDQARRIRGLRQRAIRAGLLVALLFMINLLASPGEWWFYWPGLFVGAFLAWSAVKVYYPDLVGADDFGRQRIGGDVTFSKDTRFRGKIGGDAVVGRGVHLELTGKVGGDLILERDAVAEVRGRIGGHVRNRGGTLRLSGKLGGELRDEQAAGPPVDPEARRKQPQRP